MKCTLHEFIVKLLQWFPGLNGLTRWFLVASANNNRYKNWLNPGTKIQKRGIKSLDFRKVCRQGMEMINRHWFKATVFEIWNAVPKNITICTSDTRATNNHKSLAHWYFSLNKWWCYGICLSVGRFCVFFSNSWLTVSRIKYLLILL